MSTSDQCYDACHFLIKERLIISAFVEVRFEFMALGRCLKVSSEEQIRQSRRAKLNGIALWYVKGDMKNVTSIDVCQWLWCKGQS